MRTRHVLSYLALLAISVVAVACGSATDPENGSPTKAGGASGSQSLGGSGGTAAPKAGTTGTGSGGSGGVSGGAAGKGSAGTGGSALPYLPLKAGASYTYLVTETTGTTQTKYTKDNVVMARQKVGGAGPNKNVDAFKVVTTKHNQGMANDADDRTESYQDIIDGRVVRYSEVSFATVTGAKTKEEYWVGPRLRLDENAAKVVEGATWTETYKETVVTTASTQTTDKTETWKIEKVDDEITVPAGTFKCLRVVKQGSGEAKTWWYARGIGKIKEQGGQLEELQSYK